MLSHDNYPIGALYGFMQSLKYTLRRIISRKEQTSIAVALDVGGGQNFRYSIYDQYKSNRNSTPEDLVLQLQILKPMLDAFAITHLSDQTCEADDVIASYAKYANQYEYDVVIVSGDKDLMQLISDKIKFFDINKKKFCGVDDVYEKFQVLPNQICDYLSIVGDRSDNIPGVRGIGKKIAVDLLHRFETLDGIYSNLSQINEVRIKNLLVNGYESAMLSKRLVTLKDNINLTCSLENMKWNGFKGNQTELSQFLSKYSLEFLLNTL